MNSGKPRIFSGSVCISLNVCVNRGRPRWRVVIRLKTVLQGVQCTEIESIPGITAMMTIQNSQIRNLLVVSIVVMNSVSFADILFQAIAKLSAIPSNYGGCYRISNTILQRQILHHMKNVLG